ncbi:hypothetical protein JTE90_026141 [Oedothorax gibbosus]|uniref:Uncharacterized protein n=1 Tax=Oedothorax gibbosus TaxID=931172 RepID=A0AAV6UZA4_9ARAC|nr:hypothetical protein JTE90_026141 [Oedothorax gibbosus]
MAHLRNHVENKLNSKQFNSVWSTTNADVTGGILPVAFSAIHRNCSAKENSPEIPQSKTRIFLVECRTIHGIDTPCVPEPNSPEDLTAIQLARPYLQIRPVDRIGLQRIGLATSISIHENSVFFVLRC